MELPPHTATGPITYGRRLPFALSELIELPPHAPSALLAEEWLLPTSAYKPAEEEEEEEEEEEGEGGWEGRRRAGGARLVRVTLTGHGPPTAATSRIESRVIEPP